MSGERVDESEVRGVENALAAERVNEPIARVWRERRGQWWAELWVPRDASYPPTPFKPIECNDCPAGLPDHWRLGLRLRSTRRGAERAARKMKERVLAGKHPDRDKPLAEIVA